MKLIDLISLRMIKSFYIDFAKISKCKSHSLVKEELKPCTAKNKNS